MKKNILIFVAIFAIGIFFIIRKDDNLKTDSNMAATPSPTDVELQDYSVSYNDISIVVSMINVEDINQLDLIANYQENLDSEEIYKVHGCKYLTNAGFYTEERNPIGLFVTDGEQISKFQVNNTLNGVFSVDSSGVPMISYDQPTNPNIAVQTGPVIVYKGEVVNLKLNNDFYARRMVAALDSKDNLYFFAVYNPKSVIQGPNLADLGTIVMNYGEEHGINVVTAINLDGGSASVFYSEEKVLKELVAVGSVFCIY